MKGNTVTLSLEEYTEMVLKTMSTNVEKDAYSRLKELVLDNISYIDSSYMGVSSIKIDDSSEFIKELLTILKIVDRPFFVIMTKHVHDIEAKKVADKAAMAKARAIKDLNKEGGELE